MKGLTPLTKIGFANASIPSPFPAKNEPPTIELRAARIGALAPLTGAGGRAADGRVASIEEGGTGRKPLKGLTPLTPIASQ